MRLLDWFVEELKRTFEPLGWKVKEVKRGLYVDFGQKAVCWSKSWLSKTVTYAARCGVDIIATLKEAIKEELQHVMDSIAIRTRAPRLAEILRYESNEIVEAVSHLNIRFDLRSKIYRKFLYDKFDRRYKDIAWYFLNVLARDVSSAVCIVSMLPRGELQAICAHLPFEVVFWVGETKELCELCRAEGVDAIIKNSDRIITYIHLCKCAAFAAVYELAKAAGAVGPTK